MFLYQTSRPAISAWAANANKFGTPYLSISISLNILLTLMIVTRLVLHTRNNRAALGASGGIGGLYKAIVTVLIESCALYAVSSLLIVAPKTSVVEAFLPILYETQVRTPPRPLPPDRLHPLMADWAGYCSTAHRSTSRQQERVDKW